MGRKKVEERLPRMPAWAPWRRAKRNKPGYYSHAIGSYIVVLDICVEDTICEGVQGGLFGQVTAEGRGTFDGDDRLWVQFTSITRGDECHVSWLLIAVDADGGFDSNGTHALGDSLDNKNFNTVETI